MSALTDQQMKRIRREVTQRLSLRAPQEESLKRLAEVADLIDWRKSRRSIPASKRSSVNSPRFASRWRRASARPG